ncbi:MAG: hypothetical protein Q4P05_08595 [Actinomycetaceae bacterium]|nr:hypothetical protein [Actinomycetaceae bacterium]
MSEDSISVVASPSDEEASDGADSVEEAPGEELAARDVSEEDGQEDAEDTREDPLKVKEPVTYAEDPAPGPALVGPLCGLEGIDDNIPPLPTAAKFVMEDDSVQEFPVQLIRRKPGTYYGETEVITNEIWKEIVQNEALDRAEPWGPEITHESIRLRINKPGHPSHGKEGKLFQWKRYRLHIIDQEPLTIDVNACTTPALPTELNVTYQNEWRLYNTAGARDCANPNIEGVKASAVTWDELTDEQREKLDNPGETFELKGTVTAPIPGSTDTVVWPRTGGIGDVGNVEYGFDARVTIRVIGDHEDKCPTPEPTPEPSVAPEEPKASDAADSLAKTGVNSGIVGAVAVALAAAGAGLVLAGRSRRRNA